MMGIPVDSKKHARAGIGVAVALIIGTIERMRLGAGSWTPIIVSAMAAGGIAAFLFGALMTADGFAARRSAPNTPEEAALRRQRARNVAIGFALAALVALFYIATIVRLGSNVANRTL